MEVLKEIFKITKGKKEKETELKSNGSRRYIQIEDLRHNDNLKYCIPNKKSVYVKTDDLIIAWDGANAGTIGVGLQGVIGSTLARLELKNKNVNPYYVARFLQSKFQFLRHNCTGSTIPHISKSVLESLSIPLPPLETQKKMVEVLDNAQTLISTRKEQIRLMDELIQSVFYEMFGDPVRNPKKWDVILLNDLIININNGMARRGKYNRGEIVLRLVELQDGFIDYSNVNRIELNDTDKLKYKLDNNDFLFARVNGNPNYVGRCAVFKAIDEPVYHNDHLIRVHFNEELLEGHYTSCLINSNYGKKELSAQIKTSAGQYTISQDGIGQIKAIVPPIKMQRQFAKFVQLVDKSKLEMQKSLEEINTTYQALMHDSFR